MPIGAATAAMTMALRMIPLLASTPTPLWATLTLTPLWVTPLWALLAWGSTPAPRRTYRRRRRSRSRSRSSHLGPCRRRRPLPPRLVMEARAMARAAAARGAAAAAARGAATVAAESDHPPRRHST